MIFTTWVLTLGLLFYFKPNVAKQLVVSMNDPKNCMITIMLFGFCSVILLLLDIFNILVKINDNLSKKKKEMTNEKRSI